MTEIRVDPTSPAPVAAPARPVTDGEGRIARSVTTRFGEVVAATAAVSLATAVRLWFAPFAVGVAIGVTTRVRGVRSRRALVSTIAVMTAGWAAPLALRALDGQPVLAVARVTAAFAGLPANGWIVVAVTLVVGVIQGLAGLWFGRAVAGLFRRPR